MKTSLFIAWACLAFAFSLSASTGDTLPKYLAEELYGGDYVPGQYIIEISDVLGLAGKRAYSSSPHEGVYQAMRKREIPFTVATEYNIPDILVGVAVQLTDSDDLSKLAQIPGIAAIRPVARIGRPQPVSHSAVASDGNSQVPADALSTHRMTGVDKIHAGGNFGSGIKIGIIDTGIDYTHPLLGSAIGHGHKVIGGYDFVGDNFNGSNTPVPDGDPLDQCSGHGTHVAGIIGASGDNPFGISGVASASSLAAYRVFGCKGSTTDKLIVDALLRAYGDGMDILNLSLGGVNGWTEATTAVVASRIAGKGKIVIISAGNSGDVGSWYASSPASGINVIAVGSVDNIVTPIQNATVKGVDHDPIPYYRSFPLDVAGDLPIFATSNDTSITNDACDPLPNSTPDLSGFVVVVRRGACDFTQKLDNIAARGGRTTLIYNSEAGFTRVDVGNYSAALISADDGKFLVEKFNRGAPVRLSFPKTGGAYNLPDPAGGLSSGFSSYGPTYDMYSKPAVSAPGGNILSAWPVVLGSYLVASGTSMAAPFTAGSAALVLTAKGNTADVARAMRNLLQTTASNVPSSNTDKSPLQTVTQQGAGLLQVDRAIQMKTVDMSHTISITNTGSQLVTYKLSHTPAGTALSVQEDSIFASAGPVPLIDAPANVLLNPNFITVFPGQTGQVFATISPPRDTAASRFPVYSGFINIESPSEKLKVTYMGVAAELKDKQVLDNTDMYFGFKLPALINGTSGKTQNGIVDYTMQGDDKPVIYYRLAFGTPSLRLDLVKEDFQLEGSKPKRSLCAWWWPNQGTCFGGIKTLGPLAEFNSIPRDNDSKDKQETNRYRVHIVQGKFATNKQIENGRYRVLLRALRATGDPTRQENYDIWISPVFGIKVSK